LYAQAREPAVLARVERDVGPWFRRTWVRRTREEVAQAGRQLATEARQMFDPDAAVYPSPSPACRRCAFDAPCQALYRPRVHDDVAGRLGGVTWSVGRGAAPPQFSGPP
jgi:adenine-specific DNA glycosylase